MCVKTGALSLSSVTLIESTVILVLFSSVFFAKIVKLYHEIVSRSSLLVATKDALCPSGWCLSSKASPIFPVANIDCD